MNVRFVDHHGRKEAFDKENTALDNLWFPTMMKKKEEEGRRNNKFHQVLREWRKIE